jgi:hypothetical protein
MDGAMQDIRDGVQTIITPDGGEYYQVTSDDPAALELVGTGWEGMTMAEIIRGERAAAEQLRALEDAIEAARQPRGCGRCGRTFGGATAWQVHFEAGEGSRCLPDDAHGQLVEVDGVWCRPGDQIQ